MNTDGEMIPRAPEARPWASTVLDRTRHPVALIDPSGRVLECSQSLLDHLGIRREDLVGLAPADVRYPGQRREAVERFRAALSIATQGRGVRYEIRLPGRSSTLTVELRPLQHHEPDADLTTPGPELTSEQTNQLRLVLEATDVALWTWDLTADRFAWSAPPAWLNLSDHQQSWPTEAIDRNVHPDDRARVRRAMETAISGSGTIDVEFRLTDRLGTERWVMARGDVCCDEDGVPVRAAGILLDVTDRARSRIEHAGLLQAERRASRRAAALQRVAAALSEAATTEQVAAVMVEESLRSLGADAASIELRRAGTLSGGFSPHPGDVQRAAGMTRLLHEHALDSTRLKLDLSNRGQHRGTWTLAWVNPTPNPADEEAAGPGRATGTDTTGTAPRRASRRLWSSADWTAPDGATLLRTLASECSQAIDRAELYEQQRDIATVLQRTLLPSVLPEVAGAQVAARYQPGGHGVDVGGDWYDVIELPEGRAGLVIGDVEGHSAAAAAIMGQVRNALRAYAVEGSTPAIVMQRVNRLLARLRVSQLVSCCYLEFAPTEGRATVVLAGHPPPLLVVPGGPAEFVPAKSNLMLGVDDATRYVETTVLLDPGACLLLYTDGLIESVNRSLPDGLAVLRHWAAERDIDETPDELVEQLIRFARDGQPILDDVAVLALRYRPTGRMLVHRSRAVRRTFPLDPSSASAARRFVADVLTQWSLDDVVHHVTLMTSELVTNSVLHTSGELELALWADDERLRVEVVDHSERLPTVQHPDADAPGGRGLLIIEALADQWSADVRATGKAVWFEVLLKQTAQAGEAR